MAELPREIDARGWLTRWDQQQEIYLPGRERRFRAMFDFLEATIGPRFVAIDLGCGPGSLTERLLARFPQARVVAVDYDPVLLALGRRALAPVESRVHWVETDLRASQWVDAVPKAPADAVVSTTALHWFPPNALGRLYGEVAGRLRTGGIFVNGDQLGYEEDQPTFSTAARTLRHRDQDAAEQRPGAEDWELWWAKLRAERSLAKLFEEKDRRFPKEHHDEEPTTARRHAQLLRAAGFREVGILWQERDNRVMAAVR